MSKFKRALSMILAIAMVFGSLSCLGAVVAPKASAAEGTSQVDSYESLAATYDNFVYLGSEFYELDITENADGTYSDPKNQELTDYYVDAGQILEARMYIKSDMFMGNGTFVIAYDNSFFDVTHPVLLAGNTTLSNTGYYVSGAVGVVNTSHPVYISNGIKNSLSTGECGKVAWFTNRTDYTDEELASWSFTQKGLSYTDNGTNLAYQFTSDDWVYSWYVKVKDDVTEGTTGVTETKAQFWKCDDKTAATKVNTWSGRNGTFNILPLANGTVGTTTVGNVSKNCYTGYDLFNYFLFDDLKHTFTCGKNPADASSEPVAGTSQVDSYESLAASYDNFVYLGSEFYELDITVNADGTYSDPQNHILTDYYVDAGQILEARMYIKSDMFMGNGTFVIAYDNSFFDVTHPVLLAGNTTLSNTGYYVSGAVGVVNTSHPVYISNGIKNSLSTGECGKVAWFTNRTDYTDEELASWSFTQKGLSYTDNGTNLAYQFTSDDWVYSWYVKVKDDVAEGATGVTETKAQFWKCDDKTAATKVNTWSGRNGTFNILPLANGTVGTTTVGNVSKNCYTGYDLFNYFLFDDLKHTFTCGKRPAAGSYTATFVADGATVGTVTGATGTEIAAPETNPTKDGYTFKGWALEGTTDILTFPQTMGSANVTYVAIFEEVAKYTATFVVDGTTVSTEEYAAGATVVAPADPSKTGYSFAGWSPAVGTMPAADTTYKATWTANSYTVTYYKEANDDTSLYTTLPATFDAAYTLPTAPTKTGYTFAGWVDGNNNAMPAKHTVDANVSYYATWTAGTYTATFKANGGVFSNGSDTITTDVVFGQKIEVPEIPTKTGNTFLGWSPEVGNMTAEGMTFTAQWEAAQIGVYFMDGEELIESKTGAYGSDISAITNPTKDGFTFAGWVDADGAAVQFPITLGTEPVYVYAKWNAKSYYVEFYGYGGSSENDWIAGGNQLCGDVIATPELMEYTGYEFDKWVDADGNDMPATVPAIENQVYYAKYKAVTYTATFDAAGGVFENGEATATYEGVYNSTIVKPNNPTMEGYTFKAWSPTVPTKMPAKDVTYTATWTINKYTVEYYVDNELVHTDTYEYGAAITPYTYTPAAGITFGGWTTSIPATMPAENLKIYGSTGVNNYNVTFTVNGEEYKELSFAYGAAVVAPDYEVAPGYSFSGWDVPATMPAENITLDAELTANTYDAIFYLDDAKTQIHATVPTVYGEEIVFPDDPTMDGKEFDGWDNEETVMGVGDMEFIAQWIDIEYYVEFYASDAEDAEIIYEDVLFWGDEIAAGVVENPTKEGFEFKYWTVNGNAVTLPTTVGAAIVTEGSNTIAFEPYFSIVGYDIIYMVDGKMYKTETYEFGAAIELLAQPTKEGYTFSGWDKTLPATMPAEDITVSGTFTVNQYDAVFYVDGAVYETVPTNFGETPVAPDVSNAKPGYQFQGWNPALSAMTTAGATYNAVFTAAGDTPYTVEYYTMDTTGAYGEPETETKTGATDTVVTLNVTAPTGFTVDADASVTEGTIAADGNLVLKVYYIRNQYDLTITVDGVADTKAYYYEEAIPAVADPAKTGYTFTGWTVAIPGTMPAKNVSTTAQFQINQYTITFADTGDVAYKAITQDYGTAVADVADPVKTGYTFAGWDKAIPDTIPAENITITAQWTINQYTITFVDTGDVAYEAITQNYGTDIDDIADPVKVGHTFAGWDVAIPETMPAVDTTITATWTVNNYNAIFVINGVETVKITAYGTMPEIPDTTRVGYTFTGWDKEVTVMPAEDVTYTASYSANTYDANFDANGGAWADGATIKAVATVFDKAIDTTTVGLTKDDAAAPTREGYIFAGWEPTVGNMTAEGMTFKAIWTQDLNFCRVTSVVRTTENVTTSTIALYEITVKESPIKLQIACTDGSGFTWTYDRNDVKVAGDLSTTGLVSVVAHEADATSSVPYEVWTIATVLVEGDYKVRAKVNYSSTSWESLDYAYDYKCVFDEAAPDATADMIISVDVAEPAVKRGTVNPITIKTSDAVSRLRITMDSRVVSYSQTSSVVDYTNNGDGTATWVLNIRFTYSGTEDEQIQNWTIWYRETGARVWTETDKEFEVKVTRYEPVVEDPDATYDPYTVISVTTDGAAVKAVYETIVIKTTSDATKVRFNNQAGKTTTYMTTSTNVTYVDNNDGTATWTINYRFADTGDQTWAIQCRGNAWSAITEASTFAINVAEA